MSAPLLETRALATRAGARPLCTGLDLRIHAGECWAVLGTNGAGKTTLLHTLAGLRAPAAGGIWLEGRPLASLARRAVAQRVGVLFQHHEDVFPGTVFETALAGRLPHLRAWRWETAQDRRLTREALADTELESFAERPVATLSGGERRRLGFATLLAQAPRLYLLDEPANDLDLRHQVRLLEQVRRRSAAAGGAAVMVLHDPNVAARCCDRVLMLDGGGAQQGPTRTLLTATRLSELYGLPVRELQDAGRRVFVPD